MRTHWLWISLILLAAQALTFPFRREDGPVAFGETGLGAEPEEALHLATLRAWEAFWPDAGAPQSPVLPEGLVERETRLLRLVDLEAALRVRGFEVDVAQTARNWMQTARLGGAGDAARMEAYLHLLVAWVEAFAEDAGETGGRVQLLPGKGSLYPDVQFEMAADPLLAGRFLSDLSERMPWWQLERLALHEPSGAGPWWTIGRISFDERGRL